jgi:hypothetical protein
MTTKKAADSAHKGRSKAAKKKTGEKRRKLTSRQTDLVKGIVSGKSVRRAALDAGYSERMANHAGELLSSDALRGFCQSRLSLEKVLDRIDEGMDAERVETIVLGRKGKETVKFNSSPDYCERRQSAALAARLIGADPANRIEVKGDMVQLVKVEFVNVAALQEP